MVISNVGHTKSMYFFWMLKQISYVHCCNLYCCTMISLILVIECVYIHIYIYIYIYI